MTNKDGVEPPVRPDKANPGPEPHRPRLLVTDVTVERLAVILEKQPRGILLSRDELAGWLQGMTRYSGGGSDRPFWLEAYGGRGYTVERMGREPVFVPNLSVGVTGSIQPDRLKSLLIKSDDDGLLARFLPFYPHPAAIKRPALAEKADILTPALLFFYSLALKPAEGKCDQPWLIPFTEAAQLEIVEFRRKARKWEGDAEGMYLSFIGKTPGFVVRISLILAYLDAAVGDRFEPLEIGLNHVQRACQFVEDYALPMASRAYCDASFPKAEKAACNLIKIIREKGWTRFTSREVLHMGRTGLNKAAELNPALAILVEGDLIKAIHETQGPKGGRPTRVFAVNPQIT